MIVTERDDDNESMIIYINEKNSRARSSLELEESDDMVHFSHEKRLKSCIRLSHVTYDSLPRGDELAFALSSQVTYLIIEATVEGKDVLPLSLIHI